MKSSRRAFLFLTIVVLTCTSLSYAQHSQEPLRTEDGVPLADDGSPVYSTFSLCAIDPDTGECGAIVTTRVVFVGRRVPYVKAGVGAVATQSWTVIEYGPQGLELMEKGVHPEEAIKQMLSTDDHPERRQVGLINMKGEKAAWTGEGCSDWAGQRQGTNYTVQGNLLVGQEVVDAVADHFESTEGTDMPLVERMILALEAGQKQGGDARWGRLQSAALRIADPRNPGPAKDHVTWSIDVGEHATPVAELKRIYYKTAGRLGHRTFSEIRGGDVLELKEMLHALGFFKADLAAFPQPPAYDVDETLAETDPEKYEELRNAYWQKRREFLAEWSVFDEETIAAVDAFRKQNKLDYSGNPRGLVDERFICALKKAYLTSQK